MVLDRPALLHASREQAGMRVAHLQRQAWPSAYADTLASGGRCLPVTAAVVPYAGGNRGSEALEVTGAPVATCFRLE